MLAHVIELLDHHDVRVRVAARVDQPSEGRNHAVIVVAEVAARQNSSAVDRDRLDHDHPGASERSLAVIADVSLPGQPVDRHVGGVGPEVDTTTEGFVAELKRLEDVRKFGHLGRRGLNPDDAWRSACVIA